MADQDGRHSEITTQLLRHVTSSNHDVDFKGDIFRRTIYPLVVIAFIFSELREEGGGGGRNQFPPVVEDQKKPGLNKVTVKILKPCLFNQT